jgi:hypothetical protein
MSYFRARKDECEGEEEEEEEEKLGAEVFNHFFLLLPDVR